MSDLFTKFIDAAVQELGKQVTQLAIGQIKALLFDPQVNEKKIQGLIEKFPTDILEITMVFAPETKLPARTLYMESPVALSSELVLKIRNTVTPWYQGRMYIYGSGPGKSQKEIRAKPCGVYYVEGSQATIYDGPIGF